MQSTRILKHKIRNLILILCAGLFYIVWLECGGTGIPCIFRKITGWLCPGCGITKLILGLIRLDFGYAYKANQFIFITIPYILFILGYDLLCKDKTDCIRRVINISEYIYVILLVAFGVFRNISS